MENFHWVMWDYGYLPYNEKKQRFSKLLQEYFKHRGKNRHLQDFFPEPEFINFEKIERNESIRNLMKHDIYFRDHHT